MHVALDPSTLSMRKVDDGGKKYCKAECVQRHVFMSMYKSLAPTPIYM